MDVNRLMEVVRRRKNRRKMLVMLREMNRSVHLTSFTFADDLKVIDACGYNNKF